MSMEIFGLIGMMLIQGSYIPQIVRTYRTKDVEGFSGKFMLMVFLGCLSYLIYAVSIGDRIYMASNLISMVFTMSIMIMISLYGKMDD